MQSGRLGVPIKITSKQPIFNIINYKIMKTRFQNLLRRERIAKRNGETRNGELIALYQTILGEFDTISKDPTTEQCLGVVKALIKSAGKCGSTKEIDWLSGFLPKKMTEAEIYGALDAMGLEEGTKLGIYMSTWSKNPELKGKADMKLVGKVIKESFL